MAEKMGHGGGDFWVLYNFAREILFGERAFHHGDEGSDRRRRTVPCGAGLDGGGG
jgi:hypothetical protein